MQGDIAEIAKRLVTDFGDHLLIVLVCLALITFCLFMVCWMIDKSRLRIGHNVPGSVVRDYLDAVIQNSMSLRSSLFREREANDQAPLAMPLYKLQNGESKQEQESSLKQSSTGQGTQGEPESADMAKAAGETGDKDRQIAELTDHIAQLRQELGTLGEGKGQEDLAAVAKERDELQEKLQEYEIIEHDLANLKQLQKENIELKQALGQGEKEVAGESGKQPGEESAEPERQQASEEGGGGEQNNVAAPASEQPQPAGGDNQEPLSVELVEGSDKSGEEKLTPSKARTLSQDGDKSAEDLLNEFEKMLG